MNTEMILKDFQEILEHEKRAKYFYDHYIDQVDDGAVKKVLVSIRDEEVGHIKIAEKLITYMI
ncbi:MAG: hypothetical protein ABIG55_05855 [Candidatus Omnitrophota bacterium]|nr:hypothetical protein [Candidatus Omnitrophota bacterium]